MELDELKNTWMVLDEQLKKNELLNKRMVQEMLSKKTNKSINSLINTDFFSIVIVLLAIPLCIWLYNHHRFANTLFPKITFIVTIATCIFGVIWISYRTLKYLIKIDFSKNIKDNMYCVNKYNVIFQKEKIMTYFGFTPVFSLLSIFTFYELKANLSLWVFLVVALIVVTLISYWIDKKVYDANIRSIKNSLEELQELKDE